jgi:NAD(P)-dependent dehydrogenase (short-subunit alcohol dehydrogenase family)
MRKLLKKQGFAPKCLVTARYGRLDILVNKAGISGSSAAGQDLGGSARRGG